MNDASVYNVLASYIIKFTNSNSALLLCNPYYTEKSRLYN